MALKEVLRVSLEYGNPCIQSGRLGTFRELEKLGRIWVKLGKSLGDLGEADLIFLLMLVKLFSRYEQTFPLSILKLKNQVLDIFTAC